jgi:hypothetical protein
MTVCDDPHAIERTDGGYFTMGVVRRQLVFPLATIVFPRVGWLGERPAKPLRGFARTLSCSLGLVA